MIRFLLGLILGIIVGASMAGKWPDFSNEILSNEVANSATKIIIEEINK